MPVGRPQERLKSMRFQVAAALLLLSGLVSLWTGCSRTPTALSNNSPHLITNEKRLPAGAICARDTDCRSGFCDRDVCANLFPERSRGGECDRAPFISNSKGERVDRACGRYLCLDHRCRSCTSDAECESYLGGGKCTPANTHNPTSAMICRHTPKW
jgi:hypothetical protein